MKTTAGDNPDKAVVCGPEALRTLLGTMAEQRRLATALLETVMDERRAVLENDIQGLTEINARKVATLEDFNRLEGRCKKAVAEVARLVGLQPGPETTMRQIVERLEEPFCTELDKTRSILKNTLLQVRQCNRTNQRLLSNCLELVDRSARMLRQLFDPPPVYGRKGSSGSCLRQGALVSNVA